MKLIVLTLVALALMLVVSCAPQQYVCPDGKLVDSPDACPKPKPASVTPTYAPKSSIPAEISQLFDKSSKVTGISYSFQTGVGTDRPQYRTFIRGNIVKVQFPVQTRVLYQEDFDTIIFDTSTRKAKAYCEQVDYCKKTGEFGTVDYNQYYLQTPFDWADKVTSAEKIGTEKIGTRDTILLKVNGDDQYWVDSYYGLPIKIIHDGKNYFFQGMIFNSVSNSNVQFSLRR